MSEEILINVTPRETRVALVENGVLQEVLIERARRRGIVGNIYRGRVNRVLPGMQAAFVDIGLERAAFLHASDISGLPEDAGTSEVASVGEEGIATLVREGQELLVQVIKDPLGSKGARLTTHISIPSRFLVMIPEGRNIGVSSKIEEEPERLRLKGIVQGAAAVLPPCGYILRTAAEAIPAEAIVQDVEFLHRLWAAVQERARVADACSIVHEDLPLALRALRDFMDDEVDKVRVDSRETHVRILEFARHFIPEAESRIEHYPGARPIFDIYGIEDEIKKALERKVVLKSGGYLVLDQTEALTTIDVNTGAYVGHRTLEETIFKTNLEAAQAIARQLRLRNLGGIIIIDFIDMQQPDHRRQVLRALEKSLEKDRSHSHLSAVSALGLVEMTRKRTRESLEHILCEPCPVCSGRGSLKTAETVCYEIFREILRAARQFESDELLVLAAPQVVDLVLDEESASVAELEVFISKPIRFQAETQYSQEQYDVVLV